VDEAVDLYGEIAPAGATPAEDLSDGTVEPQQATDFSSVGQETAELDMQAVLDEDQDAPAASAPAGPVFAGRARGSSSAMVAEEESLEWEMPARAASQSAAADGYQEQTVAERSDVNGTIPGQERLSFE
jgi:hypothetical protein